MSRPTVLVDAAKTNRSLVGNDQPKCRVMVDPQLLFWRKLIDSAAADAKRTLHGLPTDSAILARWWIEEHRPTRAERDDWERSFECACSWLSLDPAAERKRVVAEIEASLRESCLAHQQQTVYVRRAVVLTCAGQPVAIAKQFQLPLVSEADYEHVAGIEFPDPINWEAKASRALAG